MRRLLSFVRPVIEAMPTLFVTGLVAWVTCQAAFLGWPGLDRGLAALALVGVLVEMGACIVDFTGTAAFEVRSRAQRLLGFASSLILIPVFAVPAIAILDALGRSQLWLVAGFVLPRLYPIVIAPTRDALERRRVVAHASDRVDSMRLVTLLAMPVFAGCAATAAIQRAFEHPVPVHLVTALGLVALAWLALACAISWHAWSPGFGRFPLRLMVRRPWSTLLDLHESPSGRERSAQRREAEFDDARAWQSGADRTSSGPDLPGFSPKA